jgi:hypothetical protein
LKSGTSTWCLHREVGMYPWQLICFRQMIRFVNKLRGMPDTTLARMALCDSIADCRDHHHNNWFAQLMTFCDKIQAPVLYAHGAGVIPELDEATCIEKLLHVYHGVFTSAGSDKPRVQKYHVNFASQLPPVGKYWDAQPYLCGALSTKNISVIARFRLSSHHLACETGMWRRVGMNAANSTQCRWCSTVDNVVVQDEQHVFFACPHFQHLRGAKPGLFEMNREASLWRVFNEYDVRTSDIAWFLQETKLMYAVTA